MKKKVKVYLDTSVISALFDERNPERKSLTENFFNQVEDFEPYVSEMTIVEIERTPDKELGNKMKEAVMRFSVLSLTDDVEWLAMEYIRYGAVPDSCPEDAYHIAVTVINEIDFLLSWNFKHLVRRRTRDIVKMVNTISGVRQIEIMTPIEIL